MRFYHKILLMLCLLFSLVACSQQDQPLLHDSNGNEIAVAQLKGKWIIINYWADWCHSCIVETPELNQFYAKNPDKNVLFYGVNYDQLSGDQLQAAVAKVGITYPVLREDPHTIWQLGDIAVLPTTLIINPQGDVVGRIEGASSERYLTKILVQLQQTPS